MTSLPAPEAASLVRELCAAVRGGGASILTTGIADIGANLVVDGDGTSFRVAIQSGGLLKGFPRCRFPVVARTFANGTELEVGGLEQYRTHQMKVLHVVPVTPKRIEGFDPYRRFLDALAAELLARDPSASVRIGEL